jgi:inorganic pyrophosphatase
MKAPSKQDIRVFVKAAKGSTIEYRLDGASGALVLDRYLAQMSFPGDYGSIAQTHCDDGQPLDCVVLVSSPGHPGTFVEVRVVGAVRIQKDSLLDDMLICVPVKDQQFDKVKDVKDIQPIIQKEIIRFFETYKSLDSSKKVKVKSVEGPEKALEILAHSKELYKRIVKGD